MISQRLKCKYRCLESVKSSALIQAKTRVLLLEVDVKAFNVEYLQFPTVLFLIVVFRFDLVTCS